MIDEEYEYDEYDLAQGLEHEREHRALIEWLRERYNIDINEDDVYRIIAEDHLKEEPDYYDLLEEAGL